MSQGTQSQKIKQIGLQEIAPLILQLIKAVIKRIHRSARVKSVTLLKIIALAMLLKASSNAWSFTLYGTWFAKAEQRYGVPAALLYSVALVESAKEQRSGWVSPWPWTLRGPQAPYYAPSKKDALAALLRYEQRYGQAIDVGLMQINLRWHHHRVTSASDLLEPETNIMLGAQLLAIAMRSSPQDIVLGIGRYHHWADEAKARRYGQRVLAVFNEINKLSVKQEVMAR